MAELGAVETWEMYRTFNMGCGMIIAVSAPHANEILTWLQGKMAGVEIIGKVTNDGRKVIHKPLSLEYTHY